MIDLHMHTTYSDGTDNLKTLLKNAEKQNLKIISITDHDTCNSYLELNNINIKEYFHGNIITGCELTTSYNDKVIEILGYGVDYKLINEYMKNYYNELFQKESNFKIYVRLIKKIIELKLICNFEKVKLNKSVLIGIYEELINYKENTDILNENIFRSYSDFFRKGLTNPNSKLFINISEFKPSLKEIINLIHKSGGKVFLAHPYQYKMENTEEFLKEIYDEYNLDGIEVFYTTFSKEQINYLLKFANERNLLISGGSDYHGLNKRKHELGTGKGNLNIKEDIISNWNINYFNV